MNPHTQMHSLLSYLQYLAYHKHDKASLIRLKCDDFIFDPDRSVMQSHAATEHMGVESEPMLLEMIAEPLLLCERRPMAFTFPSTWKLRPKASAVETLTQGINEETVMLQSTLIAGGIDTIMYINQSRCVA